MSRLARVAARPRRGARPGCRSCRSSLGSARRSAHEERPAEFPDGTGERADVPGLRQPPPARGLQARQRRADRRDAGRARSSSATSSCSRSASSGRSRRAINTIEAPNTSIYVLPGVYRSSSGPSRSAATTAPTSRPSPTTRCRPPSTSAASPPPTRRRRAEDDGTTDPIALSYADQRRCAHNLNLIALFGDETPEQRLDRAATASSAAPRSSAPAARMTDVIIDNRFQQAQRPARWTAPAAPWCAT